MCEITIENFQNEFARIKQDLEISKFIGLDFEFSALYPISNSAPSLFDDPEKRYSKLRKNVEFTLPIQIGLTAFHFKPDKNIYYGKTYTFYVKPALFCDTNRHFLMESSSLEFLSLYNFDFNKFAYSGIPYLSKVQELDLKNKLSNNEINETNMNFRILYKSLLESNLKIAKEWHEKAKIGEELAFPELSQKLQQNIELKYFIQKNLKNALKVSTYENNGIISIKKVSDEDFDNSDEIDKLLENLLGFGRIYELLRSLKKPLIAHNAILDLLILFNNFEGPLPSSYTEFKKQINEIFPVIFDTKHISLNLRNIIPEKKQFDYSDLETLFEYFKNGSGRHLAYGSPAIEMYRDTEDNLGKYHEAGWDSFCTGYIFIRMAHLKIHKDYPTSKVFMPVELLNSVNEYKNCVNIVRGSVNHINLSGNDPESTRPPYFVVEHIASGKLDMKELTSTLSDYGNIEAKPMFLRSKKAIIAVENYVSAKSLFRGLNNKNSKFRVQPYSAIKHSLLLQVILWGGVTVSGAVALWFSKINLKLNK